MAGRPAHSRWIKVRRWLAESDARALKIANAPKGKNYALGPHLKWIVPDRFCSSMSEYFWESDDLFLLTDTIPRVCTVQELLNVLGNAEEIAWQKPYAVPIARQ